MDNLKTELKTICKILYKYVILPESDWKGKIYVNTFLAYLVNPDDIIPDSEENGFVDDLYLGTIILQDLYKYRKDSILKISKGIEVDDLIKNNLNYTTAILGDKVEDINNLSGYNSLERFDLPNNNATNKVSRHLKEKTKLLGAIAFFFSEIKKNVNSQERTALSDYQKDYLRSLSEIGDFFEIYRIISYNNIKTQIELKLERIEQLDDVFFDYESYLESISKIDEHQDLLKYLHPIFKTLYKIYKKLGSNWEIKHEINAAFSYLAIFEDVIDDKSRNGLIDDLFILTFVLMDIYQINPNIVYDNLEDELYMNNIKIILEQSGDLIEDKLGLVINYLGLRGLLEYYDLMANTKSTYDNKELNIAITHNNRLKRILMDLASMVLSKDFNPNISRGRITTNQLIEACEVELDEEQYHLFKNYISISKQLSFTENLDDVLSKKEEEEMELLILKHKILGAY